MNEANTFAQKLTYAQAYTDAFNHQLLVNKKNAVTEYFRNVGEDLKAFKDLEDVKGDDSISPEEYEELKKETIQQIKEFEAFLQRSQSGNMAVHVDSEA